MALARVDGRRRRLRARRASAGDVTQRRARAGQPELEDGATIEGPGEAHGSILINYDQRASTHRNRTPGPHATIATAAMAPRNTKVVIASNRRLNSSTAVNSGS